jgi:hypothetical protein
VSNWNGVPRGRFEGNALVVNLTNFNAYTWFDMAGNFHSEALKVTERYIPLSADVLRYEATMEDEGVYETLDHPHGASAAEGHTHP